MAELKVAKEAAEADFARLCVLRRIDTDEDGMTPKEIESFAGLRTKVVKAICAGTLVVEEKGGVIYTPPVADPKPITFRMAKGSTFMAMDDGKAKGEQHQMVAMIADMTGWSKGDLSKLDAPDYVFCTNLVNLFLAAG